MAENVAGLVKGVAKGYFLQILAEMKACGYRVACRVLDAQWLGVPQQRARAIFVGVREDLGVEPAHPTPLPYRYSIRDALGASLNRPWAGSTESIERFAIGAEWKHLKPGEQSERYFNLVRPDPDAPVPTITQTGGVLGAASVTHPSEPRKFTIGELLRLGGFPDDFKLTGSYRQQWERVGRAVPPVMAAAIARTLRDEVLAKADAGRPRRPG